jgi:hypothetical protein
MVCTTGNLRTGAEVMDIKLSGAQLLLLCTCLLAFCEAGRAADAEGAWANNADACQKLFQKKGDGLSFANDSDLYGSGFIVEKHRIRGKTAVCTIKLRKQDGDTVNIAATCSTDVAVETVHFAFKIVNDNKIVRLYPGLPELDTPYERCPM